MKRRETRIKPAVETHEHRHLGILSRPRGTGSTAGSERSIGFSQKMALPAFADAMPRSAWVSVEDAMKTASMDGSASAVFTRGNGAVRARKLMRRGGGHVNHVAQLGARCGEIGGVDSADAAGAELGKSQGHA